MAINIRNEHVINIVKKAKKLYGDRNMTEAAERLIMDHSSINLFSSKGSQNAKRKKRRR